MEVVTTLEELFELLGDLTPYERRLIENAYDFARLVHEGQTRRSGEAFFVHCTAVAYILADLLRMDAATVAAGLLHDAIENTDYTREDIEAAFGQEIAKLVDGVTKIDLLPLGPEGELRDQDAEYLRKMLLAMDDDVRVILIKLADRLHNMRTLSHLTPEQRERNALETLEIFAPLAGRLGIWRLKSELEDLGFRYLYPEPYRTISSLIAEHCADRDQETQRIVGQLQAILADHGIQAEVTGRPKHAYSIWRKMERKGLSFDQIYDVRAVRVIVPDLLDCYQVLGIIHDTWRPITGEFDDYIAAPKDNFYQSLHTAVVYTAGKTLEVQIRTPEMHERAEYGVAAHWRYKEGREEHDSDFERRIRHLRDMIAVGRDAVDAAEFMDVMRSEVFQDRVYAFTPKGDIVDLPMGATPIDFAYHIHTDIGHRCRGAKVNGKLVSLDYRLRTGDRVEILTAKRGGPSRDWLNPHLGYVKTKRAAYKIRQWFRRQDRDKMIALGRDVLDRELKRLGLEQLAYEQVAALFGFEEADDFLALVGFGDIHTQQIASKVLEAEEAERKPQEERLLREVPPIPDQRVISGVQIQGTRGLLTRLARCCNPVQSDEIIGYITRGRGVTIHRKDCPNVLNLPDHERLIAVEWGEPSDDERYPVPVAIRAYDREGLIRDIGAALADEHINISGVHFTTRDYIAVLDMTMEVRSAAQLSRVLAKVEQLPNVIEVRRLVPH